MQDIETKVNEIYASSEVQRMLSLACTTEPLRICFPREVNVSRFVSWLLDPSQGHGLGDLLAKSLLTRAGQTERALLSSPNEKRFLSASNIQTRAFSSLTVFTEVDVSSKTDIKCILDILAVDPSAKLYIAIENKFGAKESKDQTKIYSKSLKLLFPGYRGIHIFLDSNEAEPSDSDWFPIGYDWLIEFLADCERLAWLAPSVKSTITQFRAVIQDADDESSAGSALAKAITHVAANFTDTLSDMQDLAGLGGSSLRAKQLAELTREGASTNEAKAKLRLFQLYCRRPAIWDQCIRQRQFARFHSELQASFGDVDTEPRRVVTSFTLSSWSNLLDTSKAPAEECLWVAGINVRLRDEKFKITSWIQFADAKSDVREGLMAISKAMRKKYGISARNKDEGWHLLRRSEYLSPAKAATEAATFMRELSIALANLS